jgi:putative ABC transport system ATP-binding protein
MLKLENIKKSYLQPDRVSVPILDIPHFEIATGEQVVLVGPSGCGKTTMLHVIAGITKPDSGKVFLGGIELTRFSEAARDRIRADKLGYVFQTFNLLAGFSALENVILGMTFASKKISTSRAKDLLDQVGLSHRLHNKPGALSVGEQQRVAVARSLANQPALLLADEPTANVDPQNQQQIVDLIKASCRNENIALLMVTHAMSVADQFDRVVKLEDLNLVVNRMKQAASPTDRKSKISIAGKKGAGS